jgi:hypothetical protein
MLEKRVDAIDIFQTEVLPLEIQAEKQISDLFTC